MFATIGFDMYTPRYGPTRLHRPFTSLQSSPHHPAFLTPSRIFRALMNKIILAATPTLSSSRKYLVFQPQSIYARRSRPPLPQPPHAVKLFFDTAPAEWSGDNQDLVVSCLFPRPCTLRTCAQICKRVPREHQSASEACQVLREC